MLSSLGQRELDLQSQRFGAKSAFTFVTARWLAHHPKDGFVDRLQRVDFSPPCYPSYKVSDFYFGGIHSHWTHQPFSWTHAGRVLFPISRRGCGGRRFRGWWIAHHEVPIFERCTEGSETRAHL